ncbi:hypothetical protein JCM10213v2_001496 [Rhodosporidiobolus nylandii]
MNVSAPDNANPVIHTTAATSGRWTLKRFSLFARIVLASPLLPTSNGRRLPGSRRAAS